MEKEAKLIAGARISHVCNGVGKGLCLYIEDLDELFSVKILEGKVFSRFWSFIHFSCWASVMMMLLVFIISIDSMAFRKFHSSSNQVVYVLFIIT
jgi:hypothetical protein